MEALKLSILSERTRVKGDAEPEILALRCDVSNTQDVENAFFKIKTRYHRLDYAVNCAGIAGSSQPSDLCEPRNFDRTLNVNLRGVFLCAREELRIMKSQPLNTELCARTQPSRMQRGAIVNIASGAAVVALPSQPAYSASKAGVVALTRSDAFDYSAQKIRVNAVLPGAVATPMNFADDRVRQGTEAVAVKQRTLLRRWGLPEEIADVCLFLCSTEASFVQGVAWAVDGGYLAN